MLLYTADVHANVGASQLLTAQVSLHSCSPHTRKILSTSPAYATNRNTVILQNLMTEWFCGVVWGWDICSLNEDTRDDWEDGYTTCIYPGGGGVQASGHPHRSQAELVDLYRPGCVHTELRKLIYWVFCLLAVVGAVYFAVVWGGMQHQSWWHQGTNQKGWLCDWLQTEDFWSYCGEEVTDQTTYWSGSRASSLTDWFSSTAKRTDTQNPLYHCV